MATRRASSSSTQFIEEALSCTNSTFALSYFDPNQKWIIRHHLISLLQDFPSLNLCIDTFTHNDGTTANLLKAIGEIHVSPAAPPIFLTVWLQENYPAAAPFVYVASSSTNSSLPNRSDHPFVDYTSGSTTSSYLSNWNPRCNLTLLVRNLVKLFSHHHPFHQCPPSSRLGTADHPSRWEAMDRLACAIDYDMVRLRLQTEDEMDELSGIQSELEKRADIVTSMVIGLERERENLKEGVKKLTDEADALMNWLKVYGDKNSAADDDIVDAFEGADEKSRLMIECLAADNASEDLMYALDKAVEGGVLSCDFYVKQVRSLAREQFGYRVQQIKFLGLDC